MCKLCRGSLCVQALCVCVCVKLCFHMCVLGLMVVCVQCMVWCFGVWLRSYIHHLHNDLCVSVGNCFFTLVLQSVQPECLFTTTATCVSICR